MPVGRLTYVPGDDEDIERTVTGVPAGQTLSKAWLTVRPAPVIEGETDDSGADLQVEVTETPTASGEIVNPGGGADPVVTWRLSAADTRTLWEDTDGAVRHYDLQVRTSAGKIKTIEKGYIAVRHPEVTRIDA